MMLAVSTSIGARELLGPAPGPPPKSCGMALSFGSHVPISSAARSKLRWLESVLYASAQDRLTPRPEADGMDDDDDDDVAAGVVGCDLQQPEPPLEPPQHPPLLPLELLDKPAARAAVAARLRQKRPDFGSERHWAQVPGPLGPQPPPVLRADDDVGRGLRFNERMPGSLTAPVDVISMAEPPPTSFSEGGGVCTWLPMGARVCEDDDDDATAAAASAHMQYVPSEQKPQESRGGMETCWETGWKSSDVGGGGGGGAVLLA